MSQGNLDRDGRVGEALYRTRLLVNRTPHFSRSTRKEANRALDILEGQLGLNQVNAVAAARGIELLNRAHSSLAFGLMRNQDFADRFGGWACAASPIGSTRCRTRSWPCRSPGRSGSASIGTSCPLRSAWTRRATRSRRLPAMGRYRRRWSSGRRHRALGPSPSTEEGVRT